MIIVFTIYYYYGLNRYSSNNNNICYDYYYSKEKTCKREVSYYDYATIDIVNNEDEDYRFSFTVDYDDQYEITDLSLSYNYEKGENVSYKYFLNESGEKEYFAYIIDNDVYYKIIKYDSDSSNFKKITKLQETRLERFFNEYGYKLKELNLNSEDLLKWAKWYFETNIKEQIIASKKELNEGLTIAEIKKNVENNFDIIMKTDTAVVLKDKLLDRGLIAYLFENGELTFMGYQRNGEELSVTYDPRLFIYTVSTSDNNCTCRIAKEEIEKYSSTSFIYKDVGVYSGNCEDYSIKGNLFWYLSLLESSELLQNELDEFVIDYYNNN